ncbi:MAG: hypothetical protein V7K63_00045, partial [Nostoc sp.]
MDQLVCLIAVTSSHIRFCGISAINYPHERLRIARQFGIVFQIPEHLRPMLHEKGHVLPRYNGDESFELPIPATFVVSQDGKVVYAFVDADYTNRLDPIEIVSILRNILIVSKS